MFKLQDQVVARLANTLGTELVKAEAQRGARVGDLDAFDLIMRGRVLDLRQQQQPTRENNGAMRALFEQALRTDPNNSGALAGDATSYFLEKSFGWAIPDVDYETKVLGQLDRAIAIDPDNVYAYWIKSEYLTITHRPDEALRAVDAGLAIDANFANLYAARGIAEIYVGHFEQAKTDVQQAMRLSPRDASLARWHNYLCAADLGLQQFDAAIVEGSSAIEGGFRIFLPHTFLAAAYALKGDMEKAKAALAEARRLNPKLSVKSMAERYANVPSIAEGLRKAGLAEE